MSTQLSKTIWNKYPTQRIWTFIFITQGLVFSSFFFFTRELAFFWLGPFLTYNLALYFFPFLYLFFYPAKNQRTHLHQTWLGELKKKAPQSQIQLFLNSEESSLSIIAMSHRHHIWIVANTSFIERFSSYERDLISTQIVQLWTDGQLSASTLTTALQKSLGLDKIIKNRGRELLFYAEGTHHPAGDWQRLCFKIFHWMNHSQVLPERSMAPSQLFPILTNYEQKSYFSLYKHLREDLIDALKQGDPSYELSKSRSLFFDTHSFHRIDSSDGPGPSPAPADR